MNNEIYWETPSELAGRSAHLPFTKKVFDLHENIPRYSSFAYQGTSIESVRHLMKTGELPFGMYGGKFHIQKEGNQNFDYLREYAHMNARAHYVLNQLEFTPKSTMRFKNWIIRLQSPQHITEVKAYITILLKEGKSFGLTESKLASIIEQIRTHFKSSRRNGVLLYFNDKILDIAKARIDPHDSENSHYIKLKGDQRVSIDCIEHIECLGGFEWEFFENLENNI